MIRMFVAVVVALFCVGCAETRVLGHKVSEPQAPVNQLAVVLDVHSKLRTDGQTGKAARVLKRMDRNVEKTFSLLAARLPEIFSQNGVNAKVHMMTDASDLTVLKRSGVPYIMILSPDGLRPPTALYVDLSVFLIDNTDSKIVWRGATHYTGSRYLPINERTADDYATKLLLQLNEAGVIKLKPEHPVLPAAADTPKLRVAEPAVTLITTTRRSSGQMGEALVATDDSYRRIVDWMTENNRWGSDAHFLPLFRKQVDSVLGSNKAVWTIGWELMKSNRDYRIEWTNNRLIATELSPEEAFRRGLKGTALDLNRYRQKDDWRSIVVPDEIKEPSKTAAPAKKQEI